MADYGSRSIVPSASSGENMEKWAILGTGGWDREFFECCRRISDATTHSVVLLKAVKLAVPKDKPSLQAGLAGAQAGTKSALCERDAQGDGAELLQRGIESPETKRGETERGPFFLCCPGDGRELHTGMKKPQVIKAPRAQREQSGAGGSGEGRVNTPRASDGKERSCEAELELPGWSSLKAVFPPGCDARGEVMKVGRKAG